MKIAIGSDHRGYLAKEKIKGLLTELGYEVMDFGTDSTKSFDYPDVAFPVAQAVSEEKVDRAILLCGTGLGVSISANKVVGVRAALCHDELTAQMSRQHNDANILCLAADLIGEALLRRIVEVWLETAFEGGRHTRRVRKIMEIEKKYLSCKTAPNELDENDDPNCQNI
ncbi:MAG: ribose 5-phosphate isomerase B [Phycisphaerae bacterium]|jgi:ribose 5-phosphate isomerase B|nr:ribose 5-phosphate isomerase B [Phycisphaerae bacterium]